MTIEVAQAIAQEAMKVCRARGQKITVTVVDHANMLKAFLRDDGAMNATIEVGLHEDEYGDGLQRPPVRTTRESCSRGTPVPPPDGARP